MDRFYEIDSAVMKRCDWSIIDPDKKALVWAD
jgi:hypothetical protein